MAKFKLELKPIKMVGIDKIPQDRLQFLDIMLDALKGTILMAKEVESVVKTDDYALIIEGEEALWEMANKFHESAIISRIE